MLGVILARGELRIRRLHEMNPQGILKKDLSTSPDNQPDQGGKPGGVLLFIVVNPNTEFARID